MQLPLPDGLDPEPVIDLIPPEKDVDGLTERSMGRLVRGRPGLVGCTPLGVMRLLERYEVPTSGKRAVVIGRSTLVGLPLSLLLARKGVDATVTLAHSRTADMAAVVREADIVIGAAGQARMITADMVKPGATVIDVGVSRTESGIVGDVDFDPVSEVAGFITPMPGGTGPMTIACLLENTLTAAQLQGAFPACSLRQPHRLCCVLGGPPHRERNTNGTGSAGFGVGDGLFAIHSRRVFFSLVCWMNRSCSAGARAGRLRRLEVEAQPFLDARRRRRAARGRMNSARSSTIGAARIESRQRKSTLICIG